MTMNEAQLRRFWSKVSKGSNADDCWLWAGTIVQGGYGSFKMNGLNHRAHRLSFEIENGRIEDGLFVDHLCHIEGCINPSHLRVVTPKQNSENRKGAQKNSKTGIRGVYWYAARNRWRAEVSHEGKNYYVGHFKTLEEAEEAVRGKRAELFTHSQN